MTSPVFVPEFPGSWTTSSINGTVVSNNGTATSGTIDNNLYNYTLISITCVYGSTTSLAPGLLVYALSDVDGTNFQTTSDNPFGIQMAVSASGTYHSVFTVDARDMRKFQILVSNASGDNATVTVRYQQVQITQN